MSTKELLLPNYGKLEIALRSIGYTFEAAVADIVDNAIDAKACHIQVRLILDAAGHFDLAVRDDGHGMDENTLREAMRFGADVSQELERLGKFGLGLKLASLSQARAFSVVSLKGGSMSGRAWPEDGIASGFSSTVLNKSECQHVVETTFPDSSFRGSGTVVWWSRLYRVGRHSDGPEEHAQKLTRRLEKHLALAFHRFLSGQPRRVKITLDMLDRRVGQCGIPAPIDALDPFGYEFSGHSDFPAMMSLPGAYGEHLTMKAHIWPPNSKTPGFRLPGGANRRQGFYFYRNNRLIQGGGWNGTRDEEPHSSLARLEIDMAPHADIDMSLDVKKAEIQLPTELVQAIQASKTRTGIDFKKYLSIADDTYRTRRPTDAELPLIPSGGLPAELVDFLHSALRLKATGKHRDLKFGWKTFDSKDFFEFDRDGGHLYLNQLYRRQLLHGLGGSSADVPVLKCLLFLALEDGLSSERLGSKLRQQFDRINQVLAEAVKYERSVDG